MSANDGCVRTDCSASPNCRPAIFVLARYVSTRVDHIGKDHAGATKDIVFDVHRIIDRDIVLNTDVIADPHVVSDEYVLAQRAFASDVSAATDMAKVPYTGIDTNLRAVVYNG